MTQAADRAYAALRAGILDGRYGPGARLGEIEVAAELGLSRTPVREALRRLGSEGLVENLPNRGARVRSWSADDLDESYEVRAVLEGLGARRAAARVTREQLDQLAGLADQMVGVDPSLGHRPPGDFGELAALNAEFHALIVSASGSGSARGDARGRRPDAAGAPHLPAVHAGGAGAQPRAPPRDRRRTAGRRRQLGGVGDALARARRAVRAAPLAARGRRRPGRETPSEEAS